MKTLLAIFFLLNPMTLFAISIDNKVSYQNFSNVESTKQIYRYQALAKGVNKWLHFRTPTPIDKKPTIRMNRDTLYSFAIIDASEGTTITLPDSGQRYMSLMLVDEYGYTNKVWYGKGTYALNKKVVGSNYALALIRVFVNSNDPKDVLAVNKLQDQLTIKSQSNKEFALHNWDEESYKKIYDSLTSLFKMLPNALDTFGSPTEVDPIRFVLGAAGGYAGLPSKDAFYINVSPGLDIGQYELQLKNVPANGFWSISIYNKDGYFFKSAHGLSSVNSVSAKANTDGSHTLYFGGCQKRKDNCLALQPGWNFVARFYQPRKALQDGSWTLPSLTAIK
jgi:hypothetical protein